MIDHNDIRQIVSRGSTEESVRRQLCNFREGFPEPDILGPATAADGVLILSPEVGMDYISTYERYSRNHDIVKFVPASGAASRMFSDLHTFVNTGQSNAVSEEFVRGTGRFAFADKLDSGTDAAKQSLVYASMPKALIPFHKYDTGARTAIEEHFVEGVEYASGNGRMRLHFTVSSAHRDEIEKLCGELSAKYGDLYSIRYDVVLSVQDPATDTIAVDGDNKPFRNPDGSLLFRPAGHGALIGNLGSIDADLIFIKNIDNVTTDSRRGDTIRYKKILAGMLVSLRERINTCLGALNQGVDAVGEVAQFIQNELNHRLPEGLTGNVLRDYLIKVLDRPVRVCGMVRNEGEPGGGPFWVKNADGSVSLQILEPAQIPAYKRYMLGEGEYFNPVDLVCSTRRYDGGRFDLQSFVNDSAGLISEKTESGRTLRAQELPGLWNGAMADWTTVFVAVPGTTFSPVKVVTDLLRPEHQQEE